MNGSLLFTIPNEYPIFPLVIGASNALAFFPIFWLLYISQVAPLHDNCRLVFLKNNLYILVVWSLCYGVVFGLNVVFALIDCTQPSGFMPPSIFEPHLRFQLYQVHVMCTVFCATLEIGLSIERRVAIIKPRAYHFSGIARKTLVFLTSALLVFAYFVDFCVHNASGTLVAIGCTLMIAIELTVLAAGALTTRACRGKYEETYAKASMSARYQGSAIVSACVYFAFMDSHANMLGYLEAHYCVVNAINGSYSVILLLLKHPQLRKCTVRKTRNFIGADMPAQARRKPATEDTEIYFNQLAALWK